MSPSTRCDQARGPGANWRSRSRRPGRWRSARLSSAGTRASVDVELAHGEMGGPLERLGPEAGVLRRGLRQGAVEPTPALGPVAVDPPERRHRAGDRAGPVAAAVVRAAPDVVVLLGEPRRASRPGRRPRARARPARRSRGTNGHVARRHLGALAERVEPLVRLLPDRLEHPVAIGREADEALLDERLERCRGRRRAIASAASSRHPGEDRRDDGTGPARRATEGRTTIRSWPGASAGAGRGRGPPRRKSSRSPSALEDLCRASGRSCGPRPARLPSGRSSSRRTARRSRRSGRGRIERRTGRRHRLDASGGTRYPTSPWIRRSSRLVTMQGEVRGTPPGVWPGPRPRR